MAEMSEKIIRYDLETEINHGIQVSNLAYKTGRQMSLAEDVCYELAVAGMLHDIGKLRLSRYVSGDKNPLVIEEIKYVRRHTQLGYEALKNKGYSPLFWKQFITTMRILTAAVIRKICGERKSLWEAGFCGYATLMQPLRRNALTGTPLTARRLSG